jgi:hypothetical protein
MTPQQGVALAAEAGLIEVVASLTPAETAEIERAGARFHRCLDSHYGADETAWPGGARYAYVSTVAAIHNQHQRRAA